MAADRSLLGEPCWVEEAEAATNEAHRKMLAAYNAYLAAKATYDRVSAVAGNRRGVRDGKAYTPFPGVGTEL